MTEIIRLQNLLTQELARRFEVNAAIVFTDIVGSTPYFARFGDVEGRQLQQLHFDLLEQGLLTHGGRVVDTAGDGALTLFPECNAAAAAMVELQNRITEANTRRSRDRQLVLRIGMHWGRVLTDGVQVTGDVVNLGSRIAASAASGEIRLSREMFHELDVQHRLRCRPLGEVPLKGVVRPMALFTLDWLDHARIPTAVRVRETGQLIELPRQDIVSFGRIDIIEGMPANDVVLQLPDPMATRQISRWHFELRRHSGGCLLRAVSGHSTLVDGRPLQQGDETPVGPGSVVSLSGVMTLDLLSPPRLPGGRDDETMLIG